MEKKRKSAGFTLIELVVVMVVIVTLTSIALLNLSNISQKGRDGQRKADLKLIQGGLEAYRSDQGSYPATLYGGICPVSSSLASGSNVYLAKIPCDPQGNQYQYSISGSYSYCMRACLENANDSQKDSPNDGLPPFPACTLDPCAPKYSHTLRSP